MTKLASFLLGSAFLLLAFHISIVSVNAAEPPAQKAVLVTGASTGIGRNIAERLAREGHFVYAGARKDTDLAALSAIENIQGVRLDVTIQADIDAAVATINTGNRGLYGIVNNAGVVVMGLLAETEESELDFVFDVNVYGPYRIVKAFAPMIIESNGRISNISSMAGISPGPDSAANDETDCYGTHLFAATPGREQPSSCFFRRRQAFVRKPHARFPPCARHCSFQSVHR